MTRSNVWKYVFICFLRNETFLISVTDFLNLNELYKQKSNLMCGFWPPTVNCYLIMNIDSAKLLTCGDLKKCASY